MNDTMMAQPMKSYSANTPWGPWSAIFTTTIIVGLSIVLPSGVAILFLSVGPSSSIDPTAPAIWAPLIASQAIMALSAVWLAGWFGGQRARVLALVKPAWTLLATLSILVAICTVSLAYSLVLFQIVPDIVRGDVVTFLPMVRSSAWPIYALIIVVGAPLSEELLFRGYLQPALAKSRIGFIGASVITTLFWTVLHVQYSLFGLAEIAVIGLVFCWAMWRSGSLWTPIILHGLFNGLQFIAMRYGLLPWT